MPSGTATRNPPLPPPPTGVELESACVRGCGGTAAGGRLHTHTQTAQTIGRRIMNIHKWILGGKAPATHTHIPATHSSDQPPARAATALVLLRCPREGAGARRGWAAPRPAPRARLPSACCTHPSRRMGLLHPCHPCAHMHIYTHTCTHMHTSAHSTRSRTRSTRVLRAPVRHTPSTPV